MDSYPQPQDIEVKTSTDDLQCLNKFTQRLRNDRIILEELKDQHVVLVMGQTGVGKSALCTALVNGVEGLKISGENLIPSGDSIKYADREVFQISDKVESCTKTPQFYKVDDTYLVDCPGFEDNDKANEFPNLEAIHYIMTIAKSVKILLVITKYQFEFNRGKPIIKGLARFVSFISKDGMNNSNNFIFPIILRTETMGCGEEYLKEKSKVISQSINDIVRSNDLMLINDFLIDITIAELTQAFLESTIFKKAQYCDPNPYLKGQMKNKFKMIGIEVSDFAYQLFKMYPKYSNKSWFESDLPVFLEEQLQNYFDNHIKTSKQFQDSLTYRQSVANFVKCSLSFWNGKRCESFKNQILNEIEIASQENTNLIILWYTTKISKKFQKQAKKEGETAWKGRPNISKSDDRSLFELPETTKIISFQQKFQIFNENTNLTIKHWKWYLKFLDTHFQKLAKYDDKLWDAPECYGRDKIQFKEVIQILQDYTIPKSEDPNQTSIWTTVLQNELRKLFSLCMPDTYRYRFHPSIVEHRIDAHQGSSLSLILAGILQIFSFSAKD